MFRCDFYNDCRYAGFPRVRGDVPGRSKRCQCGRAFSPRARGCSDKSGVMHFFEFVFPACAGMFLDNMLAGTGKNCFPRVRGDVPWFDLPDDLVEEFSPRARGCSCRPHLEVRSINVFPACAGMFLDSKFPFSSTLSFPRVRGDVPASSNLVSNAVRFSPRARGCSATGIETLGVPGVFPACAGMFPAPHRCGRNVQRFPRVRGDVPVVWCIGRAKPSFSPRARGCSPFHMATHHLHLVFPACTGMFRVARKHVSPADSFPRVRGDVPLPPGSRTPSKRFSPRARGCSAAAI